jgi:uncharacterized integral membrane protein
VKLFNWLVTAPLLLLLVVFAVANRATTTLSFWPLPFTLETRVFLVVLVPLVIGFFVGELAAWINGRRSRHAARRHARRIEELERELAAKVPPKEPTREIARN